MADDWRRIFRLKVVVFSLCLIPVGLLVWRALAGGLSANPIDDITDETGRWTLHFLLITLTLRPLRHITGRSAFIKCRRMLGLFAFFYGSLHFMTYLWLDQFFNLAEILKDIPKRPFITAGFVAFTSMLPLAITSTKQWIVRLGGQRWKRLHQLIYLSAFGGVIHYLWLVKADTFKPIIYGGLLAILMLYRGMVHLRPEIFRRIN